MCRSHSPNVFSISVVTSHLAEASYEVRFFQSGGQRPRPITKTDVLAVFCCSALSDFAQDVLFFTAFKIAAQALDGIDPVRKQQCKGRGVAEFCAPAHVFFSKIMDNMALRQRSRMTLCFDLALLVQNANRPEG